MSTTDRGVLAKIAGQLSKIKNPLQLTGIGIIAIAYVLAKSSHLKEAIASLAFGILVMLFGLMPAIIGELLPEQERSSFLLKYLSLAVLAYAVMNFSPTLIASGIGKLDGGPHYQPAEQKVVNLSSELDPIKASYALLLDQPERAPEVNRDAHHLAERLLAVNDADLGPAIQIFKYEAVTYSWAMVAGSEPDNHAKLKAVKEMLDAAGTGQALIDQVMRPQPFDQRVETWHEWIIKDDVKPRLQRLSAIALCIRWQVNKDDDDRAKVREIIEDLPYDYRIDEHPERSSELRPCLSHNENNQSQKSERPARSE